MNDSETPGKSADDTDRELRRCQETGSVFVLDGPNVETQVSACPHCGSERCLDTETAQGGDQP